VRNREIKLHTQGRPHARIDDAGELDGRIRITHRGTVDLVKACEEMASKVRQNSTFQVVVFEIQSPPRPGYAAIHQVVTERVRIVIKSAPVKKVERWIGVG